MARHSVRTPVAAAALLTVLGAHAQTQLPPVTVTGRTAPAPGVTGWGDGPPERLPLATTTIDAATLRQTGVQRLADAAALDAAVSDAYNAEGYWATVTVRGITLDPRYNLRRDGLPINGETAIPLDNKAAVEILKGASGLQAGTSTPGGLLNLVVKRPQDGARQQAALQWRERGSVAGTVDLNRRFGADDAIGMRVNASVESIDPPLRDARGSGHMLAWAGEWRAAPDTRLEAEFETSRRSQPSQPGFSLLGNNLPAPGDPRINLNNQPWSTPVVFDADTASLRWQQALAGTWRFTAHAMTQRLRTDDRLAFPFGCFAADGTYYADRYCPDGTFDLYDYRSDNERRRSDAVDLSLAGRLQLGGVEHSLTAGLLQSRTRNRTQSQAFNYAGVGSVDGSLVTPAAPDATTPGTNRDERSTESSLRDAITLEPRWTAWLGLRHTRLDRDSVGTDGNGATRHTQSFTTPFAALSFTWAPGQMVYASAGRGVESEVVPNQGVYRNAGATLPALQSRQIELGLRGRGNGTAWNVALFDIARPATSDLPDPTGGLPTRAIDGEQRHRGIEAGAVAQLGIATLDAGAQWLHARREGSVLPGVDGKVPANVPQRSARLQAAAPVLPGLSVLGRLSYEGPRFVLPDNSVRIGGWTRIDAAATWTLGHASWRAGVDNLFDRRAWRESPYQFSHAYLYPLAPRTWRLAVQIDL